jgi:hypothetical protein
MDLYEFVNRNLYRNTTGESMLASQIPQDQSSVYSEDLLSGEVDGTISFTGGFIQSKNFVSGSAGWRLSANGTLEAINATLSGTITATAGTIGGFSIGSDYIRDAANSMGIASTVSGSDDVRFWAGDTYANRATADFIVTEAGAVTMSNATITGGSLTIGSNASIDSSGNATFISMTSYNMRAYTAFEAVGRFIVTGDVAPTFGNQGMTVAPGAVATHYARALWWITNYVYANNPFFTCSLLILTKGSGDARGFVGLGAPTIDGSSLATTGVNYAGFRFLKNSGTLSIEASQCDGSGSRDSSSIAGLSSLSDGDSVELFMKMTSANIKYYYRLNGGTLTLGATLSNNKPSGSETYIGFMVTNTGSANDCQIQMQSAAYEH